MNELNKAIDTAEIMLKSHVKEYQRTSASGAVSTVKEHDDSRHAKMVQELHDVYEHHDKKGRGGLGITTAHPGYATPEKYLKTIEKIRKYKAHASWPKPLQDNLENVLDRHERETKRSLEPKSHLKEGMVVKFKKLIDKGDADARMVLIENPDGGRVRVRHMVDMKIQPTSIYQVDDLEEVDK